MTKISSDTIKIMSLKKATINYNSTQFLTSNRIQVPAHKINHEKEV